VTGARSQTHERLERLRHVRVGEPEIAVAPLLLGCQQAAVDQPGQMRAGGLRRDARFLRQLGGSQRPSRHQRGQHVGAGRIADQRADERDVGAVLHGSILLEACATGNVR
jgi:hypothetical protein